MPQGTFSIASRSHLVARLAALVPRPRVNLIRYYGVFAPNSRFRARVTPAGRGKGSVAAVAHKDGATPAQRMTWAQRLRRVFRIDVETCPKCGGAVKIISSIEDEEVMPDNAGQALEKILAHVNAQILQPEPAALPPSRAPPQIEIGADWL